MAATHELFDRANELHFEAIVLEEMIANLSFDVAEYSKKASDLLLEAQAGLSKVLENIIEAAPLLERYNGET